MYVYCASTGILLQNSTVIEEMMSQICAVLDCCSCCSVLKEMVKPLCQGGDQKVVDNIWRERCIARLDVFDKFCDLLAAILGAIEKKKKTFDAKYSQNNAEKAKPLFMGTCQFQTIVTVRKKTLLIIVIL